MSAPRGWLGRLAGGRLVFDARVAVFTIASTLVLLLGAYRPELSALGWRLALWLAVPLAIVLAFRDDPRDYGLRLGDWRAGLALTAASIAVMAPILWWLGARDPAMRAYYAPALAGGAGRLLAENAAMLFGWEFLFRGFLLFGYGRRFGPDALWLQAVPFAFAHVGKPELETLSTLFGGFAFAWIAWRTRSMVWPWLIHTFVATFIVIAAGGLLG